MVRHGVFLPAFNEMAEPSRLVSLARVAEEAGFDGFFLWDHVLRRLEEARDVADPFVALAAVATATEHLILGTMVTPIVRRRPQVVARQVVTLDRLSGGRVVLGLGLGVDSTGELSRFGEVVDPRERGELLDEGAALLAAFFTGEEVHHRGKYFTADGVTLLPRAVQSPRVPMWFAARKANEKPLRRAARYDGVFLIDCDHDELFSSVELIRSERGGTEGFDIAVLSDCGLSGEEMSELGATWSMLPIRPGETGDDLESLVGRGPSQ